MGPVGDFCWFISVLQVALSCGRVGNTPFEHTMTADRGEAWRRREGILLGRHFAETANQCSTHRVFHVT